MVVPTAFFFQRSAKGHGLDLPLCHSNNSTLIPYIYLLELETTTNTNLQITPQVFRNFLFLCENSRKINDVISMGL